MSHEILIIHGRNLEKLLSTSLIDLAAWAKHCCQTNWSGPTVSWDGRFASYFVSLTIEKWSGTHMEIDINLDLDTRDVPNPVLNLKMGNHEIAANLAIAELFVELTVRGLKDELMMWRLIRQQLNNS